MQKYRYLSMGPDHMKAVTCRRLRTGAVLAAGIGAFAMCGVANAQFTDDFESLNASASGEFLSGQNGWYLPSVGGRDHKVYTYAGNALNGTGPINVNPMGGAKFASGNSANAVFGRAQHTGIDFGSDITTLSIDVLIAVPTDLAQNLWSLSIAEGDNTSRIIFLGRWETINNGTWRMGVVRFNADGSESDGAGSIDNGDDIAGPQWSSLRRNQWYRLTYTVNHKLNRVTRCSIQALTVAAGQDNNLYVAYPTNWYLRGGDLTTNTTSPRILAKGTGARVFAGGQNNVVCWDNFSISPTGSPHVLAGDQNDDGVLNALDVPGLAAGFLSGKQLSPPSFAVTTNLGLDHADVNHDGQTSADGDLQQIVNELVSPPATGQCCLPTGGSVTVSARHCAELSGTFGGGACAPGGACCFTNGTCRILTQAVCASANVQVGGLGYVGTYLGDGTSCPAYPGCGATTGACCLPDGSCITATDRDCAVVSNGTFVANTACASANCVALPTGACCVWQACNLVRSDQCANEGGIYLGNGTTCAGNPCVVSPAPANDECTGAIQAMNNDLLTFNNRGYTENTAFGTHDPEQACDSGPNPFYGYRTAWYKYTVGAGETSLTVQTCTTPGAVKDSVISIYRPVNPANPCADANSDGFVDMTEIACDDDSCDLVGDIHPNFATATATGLVTGETLYVEVSLFSPAPTNMGDVSVGFISPGRVGACCDRGPGLPCRVTTLDDCVQNGGTFQPLDANCSSSPCQFKGACCGVGSGCAVLSADDCASSGGTYGGDGVPCPLSNTPCP